jgi:hypothetical protein
MQIEKIVCDICGVEIPKEDVFQNELDSYIHYLSDYEGDEPDLCVVCHDIIDSNVSSIIAKMKRAKK